jgi:hypothetical protein
LGTAISARLPSAFRSGGGISPVECVTPEAPFWRQPRTAARSPSRASQGIHLCESLNTRDARRPPGRDAPTDSAH